MSGYLIRVGLDSGRIGGGGHAPIEQNGQFDYIPIPEDAATTEETTYESFQSRLGIAAGEYTDRSTDTPLHVDPEFETYTYGEVGIQKRRSLRKLTEGDLLVFYSSLQPRDKHGNIRLYIIGYFTVEAVHDLEAMSPAERASIYEKYPNNAHVKRSGLSSIKRTPNREKFPVIVSGAPDRSALVERAFPLSSPRLTHEESWYKKYRPLTTPNTLLGLKATDLTRSMPKKLRGDPEKIRAWLEGDYTQEVTTRAGTPPHYDESEHDNDKAAERTALRGYVLSTDSGFAPHVHNGLLSLATCAPKVRSASQPGDWVIAVGDRHYPSDQELVYAFRVEATTPMRDYYTDPRFHNRKPLPSTDNPAGDNIYAPRAVVTDINIVEGQNLPSGAGGSTGTRYELGQVDGVSCYSHHGGEYFQLHPGHHNLSNYRTDIEKSGNREQVLLSSEFYYFGTNAVRLPSEIAAEVSPGGGSHDGRNAGRSEGDIEAVTTFVSWLRSNFRIGMHGYPKHGDTNPELQETTGPGC